MSIYLKDTMDALQTLIITSTTQISDSAIRITTCGIRNKIHRLIDTKQLEIKLNKQLYEIIQK